MVSLRPALAKELSSRFPTITNALKTESRALPTSSEPVRSSNLTSLPTNPLIWRRWHSIGWAPREAISGSFLEGITREGFLSAMNISVYSYAALAKKLLPQMEGHKASLLTLSYLGGEKIVPNYNTMGLCKAALEAATRYISADIGPKGMRANTISCGPIKTLAASGIKNFGTMLAQSRSVSPLRSLVSIEDVGNAAAFLLSDSSFGITAETLYVDAGFNALACVIPPEEA